MDKNLTSCYTSFSPARRAIKRTERKKRQVRPGLQRVILYGLVGGVQSRTALSCTTSSRHPPNTTLTTIDEDETDSRAAEYTSLAYFHPHLGLRLCSRSLPRKDGSTKEKERALEEGKQLTFSEVISTTMSRLPRFSWVNVFTGPVTFRKC
ncbi:uncharacterized protein LAJ45_03696 [Morchella importuna]|uniref:uncharacterized protein n=1 Tax=Morchella importuna TaxID=1174673 RepID=UPI001E8D1377|nr:uncharacterized protein LAJ45_03696 [Morchella importuna]KAH8152270.1 hypothetical protein LAJ45_03696 [Morchella importuna]